MKQVPFTITAGKSAGTATISAPAFTAANKADYQAAIDAVVPFAITATRTTGHGCRVRAGEGIAMTAAGS